MTGRRSALRAIGSAAAARTTKTSRTEAREHRLPELLKERHALPSLERNDDTATNIPCPRRRPGAAGRPAARGLRNRLVAVDAMAPGGAARPAHCATRRGAGCRDIAA